MAAPILAACGVGKSVATAEGTLAILEAVDLEIKPAESVAIVGTSGSGKTTLLALLAGLDLPTEGQVFLAGQALTALDEEARARLRGEITGFVFQSFQLLPALTALENVMLPLELHGVSGAGARQQAADVLARVGLASRGSHYPRHLSGGEQQRVALARAFATSPRVLFADEPTGNLDQRTGYRVAELLFELNREFGTTLVVVSHDTRLAARCVRALELDEGRVVDGDVRFTRVGAR